MANPSTYPSDGRITSLQNYSSAFTGGELFTIVAPGNATAGINYNATSQFIAGQMVALSTTIVQVPFGGTGTSVLSTGVLLGNGTAAIGAAAATTAGYPLISNGSASAPSFQAQPLASTFVSGNLALSNLATINNSTILGNNAGTTGTPVALTSAQAAGILEQGMTLLNVINATAAATAGDTTSFSAAYNDYVIIFDNIMPSQSSALFECQIQANGVFQSTSYLNSAGGATTYIDLLAGSPPVSTTAGYGYMAQAWLHNVNGTGNFKSFLARNSGWLGSPGALTQANVNGMWTGSTSPLTGIQFQMSTGTLSGTIKVYGLRSAL
jgi:hypothetical protein